MKKTVLFVGNVNIERGQVRRELTILNDPSTDCGVRPPYPMLEAAQIPEIFSMLRANNEAEALEILNNQNIDGILWEERTPGMNGEEFEKKVRDIPKYKEILIKEISRPYNYSGPETFYYPDSAYI